MKKKLLTFTFTLILLIGLVAAMGMNASAADVTCTANGNIYNVNNGDDLRLYLFRAEDGDTIRLTDDIVFQNASGNFEIEPMFNSSKGGNVILDLNGYQLYVAASNSYLFDLAEVSNVSLHIVDNDPMYEGSIQFYPKQAGSSVFYLGSSNNKLYIYEGVSVTMGKKDGSVTGSQATYIINAGSYGEIGIHGAYLENLFISGEGLYFNNNSIGMRNSKVYIDGGTKIKTNSSCIDLHNSPYYPDFQIGTAILDGNNAVQVIDDNQYANTTETALKFKDLLQDGYNLYMVDGTGSDYMNNATLLYNNDTADCHIYKPGYSNPCTTHANKKDIFVHVGGHLTQCTDCGYSAGTTLHTQVKVKDATCTSKGYSKAGYDCACGRLTATVIPALGHDIITVEAKEPTCTKDGSTSDYKKCTRCNVKYDINGAPMMPAYWNSMYKKALGHDMKAVSAVAATCTKDGSIAHYDCSRCDHKSSDAAGNTAITNIVAPKTGHKEVKIAAVAATCTKEGKTEGKKCADCGTVTVAQQTIAAKGHTLTTLKAVAATCTKEGKTEGKKCSVCGTVTVAQKTVAKKAHTYKNVTTKATLTKNGKVESKCTVCGYVSKTTTVYYPKTIKLSATKYTYNGKAQTPSVTVKDSKGNTLKKDTDYTVKYASGRKNTGKYAVTITFKGKYTGTKKLSYTIAPKATSKITASQTTTTIKLTWSKVTGATGYRVYQYNTKTKKWDNIKTLTGTSFKVEKLKAGTSYKFRVKAYKKDDSTIWSAAKDITTATKTATSKITKLTTAKTKASLVWSDVAGENGFEVYASTKKDSGFKKVATTKANTVKVTVSKLTSGKTYYFKVRSYKTVGDAKVYSAWSAVKSIKIK